MRKIRDDVTRAARRDAVLATAAAAPAASHATLKLGPIGISRWQAHGVFHLRIALAVLAALAFV